jgi:hypothetical protein
MIMQASSPGIGEVGRRRIRKIDFPITISDEDKDGDLGEKLKAELPGIFNMSERPCQGNRFAARRYTM